MRLTPRNINLFLLVKLPAAFLCGVRLKAISPERSIVSVRHRWISQNPFGSMYFAVQAMAAELSTGSLLLSLIRQSGADISMLVRETHSEFTKKATGLVTFTCADGQLAANAIQDAIQIGEAISVTLQSVGTDESGEVVSTMTFEWNLKTRQPRVS
jgi:hypothetical protein